MVRAARGDALAILDARGDGRLHLPRAVAAVGGVAMTCRSPTPVTGTTRCSTWSRCMLISGGAVRGADARRRRGRAERRSRRAARDGDPAARTARRLSPSRALLAQQRAARRARLPRRSACRRGSRYAPAPAASSSTTHAECSRPRLLRLDAEAAPGALKRGPVAEPEAHPARELLLGEEAQRARGRVARGVDADGDHRHRSSGPRSSSAPRICCAIVGQSFLQVVYMNVTIAGPSAQSRQRQPASPRSSRSVKSSGGPGGRIAPAKPAVVARREEGPGRSRARPRRRPAGRSSRRPSARCARGDGSTRRQGRRRRRGAGARPSAYGSTSPRRIA